MNPWVGWGLALIALVAGWRSYGWPGVALAGGVIVFWLLIQFNRSVRVMRNAGQAAVGHVDSAVMLHSKLRPGLPMLQLIAMTKSLGRRVADAPETWAWADASAAEVQVVVSNGRVASWVLTRPAQALPATDDDAHR